MKSFYAKGKKASCFRMLMAFREEQHPRLELTLRLNEQSPGRRQDGFPQRNRLLDGNRHGLLLRNTSEELSFQKRHHDLKI